STAIVACAGRCTSTHSRAVVRLSTVVSAIACLTEAFSGGATNAKPHASSAARRNEFANGNDASHGTTTSTRYIAARRTTQGTSGESVRSFRTWKLDINKK